MTAASSHQPVLLHEMLAHLAPKNGETYIDGTFGAGGYSRAILAAANCNVIAVDRDPDVEVFARKLKEEFPDNFKLIAGNFSNLREILELHKISDIDGIVLDIGISSMQVDRPEKGFSFMRDGPLDMRMSASGKSAADFVNSSDEKLIADVIYNYGGEKKSRYIARAIIEARKIAPIKRTLELAEIVKKAVHSYHDDINPATRTFQAIRIWVNDELEELANVLNAAEKLLKDGGRLVVITFHSLEDRIVKDFFNDKSGKSHSVSRYEPEVKNITPHSFKLLTRKVVVANESEVSTNPRARSAKLRAAVRINKPTAQKKTIQGGAL